MRGGDIDAIELSWRQTEADHVLQKWRLQRRQIGGRGLLGGSVVLLALALLRLFGGAQAILVMALAGTVWAVFIAIVVATAPSRAVAELKRAGLLPLGPTHARFDAAGVSWRHEGAASRLPWGAFTRIVRDRRGLWLYLCSVQAQFVPERALRGVDLGALDSWRKNAARSDALAIPAGCDVWALDGELDTEDWMLAVDRVSRAPSWRRWLTFARLPVLLCAIAALLSLSGLPIGPDFLIFSGAAVAWVALATAAAPRIQSWIVRRQVRREPARVPVGPTSWRIGPGGVWMRTARGDTWFSWGWIGSIARDQDGVTLVVGRVSVIAVPSRLISRPDAFAAACADWSASSARLRGGAPVPGRGSADDSNPFAPTDS